jgi:hypothetical protein
LASTPATDYLVVFDPTGPGITGKSNKDLVPSLAAGDQLPGLISTAQTDPADYAFTVEYHNGTLDPRNDFRLDYTTGTRCGKPDATNCHTVHLDATSFQWQVIDGQGNSRGRFQGTATLVVDGVTTTNPFTVDATDGDRLTLTTADHFLLRVYPQPPTWPPMPPSIRSPALSPSTTPSLFVEQDRQKPFLGCGATKMSPCADP